MKGQTGKSQKRKTISIEKNIIFKDDCTNENNGLIVRYASLDVSVIHPKTFHVEKYDILFGRYNMKYFYRSDKNIEINKARSTERKKA